MAAVAVVDKPAVGMHFEQFVGEMDYMSWQVTLTVWKHRHK